MYRSRASQSRDHDPQVGDHEAQVRSVASRSPSHGPRNVSDGSSSRENGPRYRFIGPISRSQASRNRDSGSRNRDEGSRDRSFATFSLFPKRSDRSSEACSRSREAKLRENGSRDRDHEASNTTREALNASQKGVAEATPEVNGDDQGMSGFAAAGETAGAGVSSTSRGFDGLRPRNGRSRNDLLATRGSSPYSDAHVKTCYEDCSGLTSAGRPDPGERMPRRSSLTL